jgi:adenylylsulfate kinase
MGGIAVWITGLPGSGKSTLSDSLKAVHPDFVILRMDEMRKVVTPEPSYSEEERDLLYRCIVFLSRQLTELDHNVIIDATGNLRKWRDLARTLIPGFVEVYLACSVDECRRRELHRRSARGAPKDIYKKGERGWPVPGVGAPYEKPLNPEIAIDAENTSIREKVELVSSYIKDRLWQGKPFIQQT